VDATRGAPRPGLARRLARAGVTVVAASALLVAGCGGGERQDEDEPEGTYKVEIVKASFPGGQKLAKRSTMEITVRNADSKRIPNVAITVKSFQQKSDNPDLADPSRPVFIVNRAPRGGDTAYVDTYALGSLRPGRTKTFTWNVTAVKAGPYKLDWRVAAGLDGKAKAELADGGIARGTFRGRISSEPPDTRVADDGTTVVEE
jgi:hypothetical protein